MMQTRVKVPEQGEKSFSNHCSIHLYSPVVTHAQGKHLKNIFHFTLIFSKHMEEIHFKNKLPFATIFTNQII